MSFTQIDSIYQQVWTSNIQFWSFPIFLGTFMSRGIFWKLEPLNSQIGSFLAVHCCWSSHFDWSLQSFEILLEKQSVNVFLKPLMHIIRTSLIHYLHTFSKSDNLIFVKIHRVNNDLDLVGHFLLNLKRMKMIGNDCDDYVKA